ncbi:MAG: hypothetical protein ACR2NS_10620 [Gemmatimonadaceae bacterium]
MSDTGTKRTFPRDSTGMRSRYRARAPAAAPAPALVGALQGRCLLACLLQHSQQHVAQAAGHLQSRHAPHPLKGLLEALVVERLHQIIDRREIECLERVPVVRRRSGKAASPAIWIATCDENSPPRVCCCDPAYK